MAKGTVARLRISTKEENIHNGSFREDSSQARRDLIREIEVKLRAYYALVLQHSDIASRPKVPDRNATSIGNWLYNQSNAIHAKEADFVNAKKDLFAAVPKSKTPLRGLLERSSHFRLLGLWRKAAKVEDENLHYTSDTRIDAFVNMVITLMGLVMLIVPLWVLASVTPVKHRLAIITAFVVMFLYFVSFSTVARPFETLGAAAAYAAVLVVFLQITP